MNLISDKYIVKELQEQKNKSITLETNLTEAENNISNISTKQEENEVEIKNIVDTYVSKEELNKTLLGDNITVPEGEIWVKSALDSLDGYTLNEDGYFVISNTSAEVDLSAKEISFVKFGASDIITKITLYNNSIEKLDVSMLPNIERIYIQDNPICNNKEEMLKLMISLPDRNEKPIGSITTSNQDIRREVEYTGAQKEWYFGSLLQFDSTEYAKIDYWQKAIGLVDVWESAEYGEGTAVVILDSGFSKDLTSIDYNSVELYATDGTNNTFLPSKLQSQGNNYYHGNSALSLAIGNGKTVYGACPKGKAVAIKIVDEEKGYPTHKCYMKMWDIILDYAKRNEVVSMEWSNTSDGASMSFEEIMTFFEQLQSPSLYSKGTCILCNSAGNDGEYYTSPLKNFQLGAIKGNLLIGGVRNTGAVYQYTTPRENIDIAVYANAIKAEKTAGTTMASAGTSVATHIMNGCVAIVYNMLKKKNGGVPPTNDQLYNYIIRHTKYNATYRNQWGNGVFSLYNYNTSPYEVPKITRTRWSDESITILDDNIRMEIGTISGSTGINGEQVDRLRSVDFIDIPKGTYTITKVNSDYQLALRFYNQDGSFYGKTVNGVDFTAFVSVTEFTITEDLKMKILLGKTNNPTLDLNNLYLTELFQITLKEA